MRTLLSYVFPRACWSRHTRLTGEHPGEYLTLWRQRGRKVLDCTEVRVG
jgi:hypothetical protein